MKSMKLYDNVRRIHNELAALGISYDAALRVDQLTPFDQYHYFGTDAVDAALEALDLQPGSRVLDIGSGIGGPARYIAAKTGAHVTALELQPDLNEVARDLTARCGLSSRVEHVCGDILDGAAAQNYDAIISFLCFLHIPDRRKLLAACRAALKPFGAMYIEDYGKPRAFSAAEAEALLVKVQCPFVPKPGEYEAHLRDAMTVTKGYESKRADFMAQVRREHRAIVTAVLAGDPKAARAAAIEHHLNGERRLIVSGVIKPSRVKRVAKDSQTRRR